MSHDEIAQLHKAIRELKESNDAQFISLNAKVDPMYQLFSNATGFNNVSIIILKGLLLLGAGVGVVIAFIKWLKAP